MKKQYQVTIFIETELTDIEGTYGIKAALEYALDRSPLLHSVGETIEIEEVSYEGDVE